MSVFVSSMTGLDSYFLEIFAFLADEQSFRIGGGR